MKFDVNAPNPSALLRGTLTVLAENFGGYKDGTDFLELFDDLINGVDPELTRLGAMSLRDLVNRVEGATSAYQLNDSIEATFVDTDEDDDALDANVGFVAPTEADRQAMAVPVEDSPIVFRLVNGPEGLFRSGGFIFDRDVEPGADFGLGGDIMAALHGLLQPQPERTVDDVLNALDPVERLTLLLGLGPQLFTLPVEDVEEQIALMRQVLDADPTVRHAA